MQKNKKMSRRKSIFITGVIIGLYIAYVILLFWFQPFVASAEEAVPGGTGNKVVVSMTGTHEKKKTIQQFTLQSKAEYEIVGYLVPMMYGKDISEYELRFAQYHDGNLYSVSSEYLEDCTGFVSYYDDGKITSSTAYTMSNIASSVVYRGVTSLIKYNTDVAGCKIFEDSDSAKAYFLSGSLDGMVREPVLDKDWYLKDVKCIVSADDSPSSEAGEDATYITFTWNTDNLQEDDLLEIKTHNYYKSLNGEEHGGFYDYITQVNNMSAYEGRYGPFPQYEATKAWYKSLDYHPLFFKSYDTDIYFLRPVRNGKVGGWVKIYMKRNPLIKGSPYIEKIEYGDIDKEGNWTVNEDLTEKEGGYGVDQNGNKFYPDTNNPFEGTNISGIFKTFFDFFKDIPSMLGGLPGLVNSTIGFLPNWVIGFIAIGIVVVIILRIVGR